MIKDTKYNSHRTAISRKVASTPLRHILSYNLIKPGMDTLDYGCGKGKDVGHLWDMGVISRGFDPHQEGWQDPQWLGYKYDVITCTYVLNVVDKSERKRIIERIQHMLKPKGKAYISVRRDIKKPIKTKIGTHQWPIHLPLKAIRETSSYCIYELNKNENTDFLR